MGSKIPFGQNGENSAVKIKGAVSPAALAIDNTTPVAIGVKALGRVIWLTVTKRDAPTPSAARLRSSETSFKPSSVVLTTVGSINTERAVPPAIALKVLPKRMRVETITP